MKWFATPKKLTCVWCMHAWSPWVSSLAAPLNTKVLKPESLKPEIWCQVIHFIVVDAEPLNFILTVTNSCVCAWVMNSFGMVGGGRRRKAGWERGSLATPSRTALSLDFPDGGAWWSLYYISFHKPAANTYSEPYHWNLYCNRLMTMPICCKDPRLSRALQQPSESRHPCKLS